MEEDDNKDVHLDETGPDGTPKNEEDDPQDPGEEIINEKDPLNTRFLVNLPEKITVTQWSKVSEIKTTWKTGIREIENIF